MAQKATFQGLSVLLLKLQSEKEIQMHMLHCCGSKKILHFVSILQLPKTQQWFMKLTSHIMKTSDLDIKHPKENMVHVFQNGNVRQL